MVTRRTKRCLLNDCYLSCEHGKGLIFAWRENSGATLAQMLYFSESRCEVSETVGQTLRVWVVAVKWHTVESGI